MIFRSSFVTKLGFVTKKMLYHVDIQHVAVCDKKLAISTSYIILLYIYYFFTTFLKIFCHIVTKEYK